MYGYKESIYRLVFMVRLHVTFCFEMDSHPLINFPRVCLDQWLLDGPFFQATEETLFTNGSIKGTIETLALRHTFPIKIPIFIKPCPDKVD